MHALIALYRLHSFEYKILNVGTENKIYYDIFHNKFYFAFEESYRNRNAKAFTGDRFY